MFPLSISFPWKGILFSGPVFFQGDFLWSVSDFLSRYSQRDSEVLGPPQDFVFVGTGGMHSFLPWFAQSPSRLLIPAGGAKFDSFFLSSLLPCSDHPLPFTGWAFFPSMHRLECPPTGCFPLSSVTEGFSWEVILPCVPNSPFSLPHTHFNLTLREIVFSDTRRKVRSFSCRFPPYSQDRTGGSRAHLGLISSRFW